MYILLMSMLVQIGNMNTTREKKYTWNRLCRTKFYRYVSCNCMCISVIFITAATRHRILNLKHSDCSMHCIRQKSPGWLYWQKSSGCSKIRVSFTNKHHSKGPNMPPAVVLLSGGNFGFATLSNRRVIRRIFWCEPKNCFLTQYESRGTSLHTAKFCSTQPIPCG